jgi:hypothetical protein
VRRHGSGKRGSRPGVASGPVASSAMRPRRGGGRWAAPTWWWPADGGPRPVLIFSFFVLFAVRLNSGARQTMLDAVSRGCWTLSQMCRRLLLFFLSCAGRDTRQRLLTVCFLGRRTTKGLYRAKICRVPFAVRLVENAWQSLCRVFSSLCRAPETHGKALFSGSGCLIYFVPMEWSGCPYPYPSRQNHLFHKDTKCSIFCKY